MWRVWRTACATYRSNTCLLPITYSIAIWQYVFLHSLKSTEFMGSVRGVYSWIGAKEEERKGERIDLASAADDDR